MNLLDIPFVDKLGIRKSEHENYLFELDHVKDNHNHLSTIHAAAIFGLAETCSGQFCGFAGHRAW